MKNRLSPVLLYLLTHPGAPYPPQGVTPIDINVAVVIDDPVIDAERNRKLTEVMK